MLAKTIYFPVLLISFVQFIAYILLVGPPKAMEIQTHANRSQGELEGHSLFIVLLSETALRAGGFLILGYLIEYFLGNETYEYLRIDSLFLCLMIAGCIHITGYYFGKSVFSITNKRVGILIYFLGRNFSYAILPAIFASLVALYLQFSNQLELFSGILVPIVFFITYLIFVLLGIYEAILSSLETMSEIKQIDTLNKRVGLEQEI